MRLNDNIKVVFACLVGIGSTLLLLSIVGTVLIALDPYEKFLQVIRDISDAVQTGG